MRSFSFDAKKTIKGKFKPSTAAEKQFFKALKKIAQFSGDIVDRYIDGSNWIGSQPRDIERMKKALDDYSKQIKPWAEKQSLKLLNQVQKSNKRAYQNKSKLIGGLLKRDFADKEVGETARLLLFEQVDLITSIPIEAGIRAQEIAFDAFLSGVRAEPNQDTIKELQKQLGLSTEVAISRARLIARTETARANAAINQARAMAVGSGQYRWHNSGDEAVRHSHKFLNGKRLQGQIFDWDNPPELDDGMKGHPGTFPNCRCFAEPIFGDE